MALQAEGLHSQYTFLGQLFRAEVSTSMPYRTLLQAEMFGFDIKAFYPLRWNEFQPWDCNFTLSKVRHHIYHPRNYFPLSRKCFGKGLLTIYT